MGEQTNRAEAARGLRKALPLQHRCALVINRKRDVLEMLERALR